MTSNNLYDYNVKLLGLLPLRFSFFNDENNGIRFQTHKLKKIKKPSEDRHDGQVVISDENLLRSTAVTETKIIHQITSTVNGSNNRKNVNDEVCALTDEVVRKVTVTTVVNWLTMKEKVIRRINNHLRQ